MPGFVTHYLFGVDAYKRFPFTKYKKNLLVHHSAYALGLQGPDLFFYFFPSYFIHRDNMGAIAHDNNTGAFFTYLVESRKLFTGNPYAEQIADAYICGFLGHYSLDCECHPYIYARTKYDPRNPKPVNHYFGQHAYLETELDNTLLFMKKVMLPNEFHQNATIHLSPMQKEVIAKMLVHAYRNTFPDLVINKGMMKAAFFCMETGTRLLNDPSGRKKSAVRFLENKFNGDAFISPMVPSDDHDFVYDPLNNTHHMWVHPWTKNISSESFLDLYQRASEIFDERLHDYFKLVATGFEADALTEFCNQHGNRSFLSGQKLTQ